MITFLASEREVITFLAPEREVITFLAPEREVITSLAPNLHHNHFRDLHHRHHQNQHNHKDHLLTYLDPAGLVAGQALTDGSDP